MLLFKGLCGEFSENLRALLKQLYVLRVLGAHRG